MAGDGLTRRGFLGAGAATTTGALLAPTESVAALIEGEGPGLRHPDEVLAGIHDQEHRALNARLFGLAQPPTDHGWEPEKLVSQAVATSLWAGRLHAATPEELVSAPFQEQVRERLEGMSDTIWGMAAYVDGLGDEGMDAISAALRDDPTVMDEVHETLVAHGKAAGVPRAALRRYTRAHEHVAWRMANHGGMGLAQDTLRKVDRVARRHQVDWRAAAHQGADRPFVRSVKKEPELESPHDLERKRYNNALAGGILLGIGGGLTLFGAIATPFGGYPFAVAITIGVILLVIGMIALIVSARNRKRLRELTQP
jgi:hypothetical protein